MTTTLFGNTETTLDEAENTAVLTTARLTGKAVLIGYDYPRSGRCARALEPREVVPAALARNGHAYVRTFDDHRTVRLARITSIDLL